MTSESDSSRKPDSPGQGDGFSRDVLKIIDDCVRSVGHLESLLFLYENRSRGWTAAEVARELRTNETYAAQQLEEMCPAVRKNGNHFEYSSSSELDSTMQKLVELYRDRRHALITYIYTKPVDAVRSFADAFKFRKD